MKRLIHSFTVRKVMELLLTLLIVTFLSFLLVKLSPVDAAEAYARRTFMLYTPEQLDALREKMGLNQPLLVQYGTWIRNALHLDFGTSLVNGRSVFGEVSRAMGVTLSIVLIAAAIEVVGILLVGSLCYWCRRKWIHLLLVFVCIVGVSIPPFFLASSFLDVFAVRFGWISVASSTGLMRYLPAAICLALGGIALYSQLLSQNIEREMNEDNAFRFSCLSAGEMILSISGFSFIGLSLGEGVIDWGSMVSEGRTSFGLAPGLVLYPMLVIFLCVLSFNLLGRQLESGGQIDA